VKNFYAVLSQKEQDIARLRKEIAALLTVIPLLEDGNPSLHEIESKLPSSTLRNESPVSDKMTDLELYYPFVKTLQSR
jgi:hypothetical protein